LSGEVERIAWNLLDLGLDDWVPFGQLISEAAESGLPESQEDQLVREVLNHVLRNGLMVAGDLNDGFKPWAGSVEDWESRILELWRESDPEEDSYFCWFANTPEGDRLAKVNRPA
jgi:hypothetical protein